MTMVWLTLLILLIAILVQQGFITKETWRAARGIMTEGGVGGQRESVFLGVCCSCVYVVCWGSRSDKGGKKGRKQRDWVVNFFSLFGFLCFFFFAFLSIGRFSTSEFSNQRVLSPKYTETCYEIVRVFFGIDAIIDQQTRCIYFFPPLLPPILLSRLT